MITFGDRLKYLRQRKNLTQKQFAKKFGLSESAISMYERNEREPNNLDLITSFAEFFEVSNDYLLGKTDDPSSKAFVNDEENMKSIFDYWKRKALKDGAIEYKDGIFFTHEDIIWLEKMVELDIEKNKKREN
jgi:transcriptional regulator with XRE-family HTH domain